jgi:hypothetical protein
MKIKRCKAKKRCKAEDRYDDTDRRVQLPFVRISKRAKELLKKNAKSKKCTQSFIFEQLVINSKILNTPRKLKFKKPKNSRAFLKVYIHPIYLDWMLEESKKRDVSLSLFINALIESYEDYYLFELNLLKIF